MVSIKQTSFVDFTKSTKIAETNMMAMGIVVASIVLIVAGVVSTCFVARRKNRRSYTNLATHSKYYEEGHGQSTEAKPVISLKNAAGPGGLKKSPSPILSPEGAILESATHVGKQQEEAGVACSVYHSLDEFGQKKWSTIDWREDEGVEEDFEDAYALEDLNEKNNCGTLTYCLNYNFERNALTVHIAWATGLVVSGHSNGDGQTAVLDPYVKLQLLPEKQHKIKTRVLRNTRDPIYDEEFVFYGINYNQLQSTTLHFAVVAFDRFLRDKILGEALCPLNTVSLKDSTQVIDMSTPLVGRCMKFQNVEHRGELLVSICFQPAINKLGVVILKAKNLPAFNMTGVADPYVKIYLWSGDKRMAKKKSQIKKRTLSPVYNEIFVFDYPEGEEHDMNDVKLEIKMMDWDRIGKNEIMGRLEIGSEATTGDGQKHWQLAHSNPWKQIAHWHKLIA